MWRDGLDKAMVSYLLGELSDDDRDRFEDRYFADNQVHEQLRVVEDEIVLAYTSGELTKEERAKFEELSSGSSEHRQSIAFASAAKAIAEREFGAAAVEPAPSGAHGGVLPFFSRLFSAAGAWKLAVAAGAVAALLFVWLSVNPWRAPITATFVLHAQGSIGVSRGSAASPEQRAEDSASDPLLSISPRTLRVELEMRGAPVLPRYTVALKERDNTGAALWHSETERQTTGIGSAERAIKVSVPAGLLRSGEYDILVSAPGADGELRVVALYSFRVQSK
jgi:hypothetical protein